MPICWPGWIRCEWNWEPKLLAAFSAPRYSLYAGLCPAMLNRKTEDLEELLSAVRETYGAHSVEPYGDWDDPRSLGFRIRGIPATFSLIAEDRLPERHYSIQIESYPPQETGYIYIARAVSLYGFLELLTLISGPKENWPKMTSPAS